MAREAVGHEPTSDLRGIRGGCNVYQASTVHRTIQDGPEAITIPTHFITDECVFNWNPLKVRGDEHGLRAADLISCRRAGSVQQARFGGTDNSTAIGPDPSGLTSTRRAE